MEVRQTNSVGANPQLGVRALKTESLKNQTDNSLGWQTSFCGRLGGETDCHTKVCGNGKLNGFAWFLILAVETIIEVKSGRSNSP